MRQRLAWRLQRRLRLQRRRQERLRRRLARVVPERVRVVASGSLLGPVLTLISGMVAAQSIGYLARPLLTRLFTPEAFGLLGFYLAVVAIGAAVATGRYEDAVPLPERERDAAGVLALALGLSLLAALPTLLLIPFREPLAAALGRPEVAPYLPLVPLGLLATAWGRAAEVWLARRDRFRTISLSRVVQTGTMVPVQVAAGLMGGAAMGLVGGHLAGRVAATAALGRTLLRRGLWEPLTRHDLRRLARRFRHFPLFAMPAGFLNTLSMQLPVFALLALFSPQPVGYYTLAYGTLAVPMQIVGASIGQVFFVRAAEAHRAGALAPLTRDVFTRLSVLGLFPMAALVVAGPALFEVVFGAAWREAGVYVRYLAPWLFFVFTSSPISTLVDVLERQRWELGYNVALTTARAAALTVGGLLGEPVVAVALFGGVSALFWAGYTLWILRWGGVSTRATLRTLGRHVLLSAGPLALVLLVQMSGVAVGWTVAAVVAAGALALALAARFEPGFLPPSPTPPPRTP